MRHARAILTVVALALASCTTSKHFAAEDRDAREAVHRAEEAGAAKASSHLLEAARDGIADARNLEQRAMLERQEGKDQLRAARHRREESTRLISERKRQLDSATGELARRRAEIASIEARGEELRRSGATDEEVRNLTAVPLSVARVHVRALVATITAREDQVRARELEREDAELLLKAAHARITTSEKLLSVARDLYVRAQEQARVAEAEAHDFHRSSARERMSGM